MRIFLAGATGAIGRRLLPRLIEGGHEVTALTRSEGRAAHLRAAGARPVVADVFDREALLAAVETARPEAVIHQLTSIPARMNPRRIRQELAPTNRLRTEGTQVLMDAAQAAGARRFIAQSVSFYYAPGAAVPATEEEPLYHDAPAAFAELVHATEALEDTVLSTPGVEGMVLRYGYFYGPGTAYAAEGSMTTDVARGRLPLLGDGGGVFSFIHVDDAAAATVLALDRGTPGIYNIVDDEPAPLRVWLPYLAALLDAPRPKRLPTFIGRLGAGRYGVYFMTEQRGASNQKARHALGWAPRYASWREGFAATLARAEAVGLQDTG